LPPALAPAHEGAFDKAYREEQPRLQRYFDWKAGPDSSADLVQDVFLRALCTSQAERLDNPAGYLWRIARNLVIDTLRVRHRRGGQVPFDETQHSPDFANQAAILEGTQLQFQYEQALAALPARTRNIFLMHRLDELTYQEIATAMGLTTAGVEYHMSKALAHLAKRLGVHR
jgi:RNA polymerase sigma-70 factor (ECF subfamily)